MSGESTYSQELLGNFSSTSANDDNLMMELSTGLKAFQDSIDALGLTDDVLLYECSDFTRTMTPNGSWTCITA